MDPTEDADENDSTGKEPKKLYEPERNTSSESDDDANYQESDRKARKFRGEDKVTNRGPKQLYGEKHQGRGKVLIFSSSSHQDNGRGRGRDGPFRGSRGRNNGPRSTVSEDREDGASFSSRKNIRMKPQEKGAGDGADTYPSEEGRIGRQLRLLMRETDEEVIAKICQQLQELFLVHDNVRYVRYNLMSIGNSLMDIYKVVTSSQARREVSITLSRLGFVSDHDFHSFAKWIVSAYQKEGNEKICCSIMDALTELLKLNETSPRLKNIDTLLLPGLQSALETADTPDLFEATLSPVLMLALKNRASFLPYFRDTVDILVGWFIDPTQPRKVARSASRALKSLRLFWREDLPFSKTLLSQFMEDLDAYVTETKELLDASKDSDSNDENSEIEISFRKIGSLLNVFTVVGAQVFSLPDTGVYSASFLNGALTKINECAIDLSNFGEWEFNSGLEEALRFANDAISLLVSWLGDRITTEALMPCLDRLSGLVESAATHRCPDPVLMSLLGLMSVLTEQRSVASQLPVETIQSWMDLTKLLVRLTRRQDVLCRLALVLRTLIKIKNVPLLMEVYRHILTCLDEAFTILENKEESDGTLAEENALFFLSPLAELGRSSNFVGMWALEPSLLNMLTGKMQPSKRIRFLFRQQPSLFFGILRVVHCHSKSHGHFVANSSLLANTAGSNKSFQACNSPTSGNLSLILILLTDLCFELSRPVEHVTCATSSAARELLIEWTSQLLETCKPCTSQLSVSDLFQRFLSAIVGFCYASATIRSPLKLDSVLSALFDLPEITLKTDIAIDVVKTCILQLRNQNGGYLHLLGRCSPQVVQEAVRRIKNELLSGSSLAHWVQNDVTISVRSSQQFFDYIIKGTSIASYESIYGFYVGGTKANNSLPAKCDLPYWLAVQTALLCVNSKLRSPLGKPQDTFLAIEDAIKSSASASSAGQENVPEKNLAQLNRVRLLLAFFEVLEKFMYNAFDGCSIALSLAPKPIRVFFRTNQGTCQEWVNRMTPAAMISSIRAGRYASAARYGLNLLVRWAQTRRAIETAELENVLHQLVYSLIKLEAPQQIRGLKRWLTASEQAGFFQLLDLGFLDAAAYQAEAKFEKAVAIYKDTIKGSQFIENQILNSYTALADWEGFMAWKKNSTTWAEVGTLPSKQTAELMQLFDCRAHLQWPEKLENSAEVQWSSEYLLAEAKTGLLVAADRIRSSHSIYPAPTSTWKIVDGVVNSCLELSHLAEDDVPRCWLPMAHSLSYKAETAYLWMEHTRSVLSAASRTELAQNCSSSSLEWSRWLHWYAGLDRQAADLVTAFAEANLSTVALARHEGNLQLAERQLLVGLNAASSLSQQGSTRDLATQLMNQALKMKLTSTSDAQLSIRMQFEGAKLLFKKGDTDAAISVLTQCSLALSRSLQSSPTANFLPYMAESFTLLAKWLQQHTSPSCAPLRNIGTLKELANVSDGEVNHNVIISKLMERASQFAPSSSEAWLAWGQFQYAGADEKIRLTSDWLEGVVSPEESARLISSFDELSGFNGIEQVLEVGLKKKPAVLKRLLSETEERKKASADGFNGALKSFLRYLNLNGTEGSIGGRRRDMVDVTLRILRILSRQMSAEEEVELSLMQIFTEGVERTAPSRWRSITPQLLSLLQHGRPWFRSLASQLLNRLASDCPQLLVFSIAIGAAGLAWSWSVDPVEEAGSSNPATELQTLYQDMMERMGSQVPDMVKDVQLLLKELRRLVLLRDELWVAVLQQLHPQMEVLLQKLTAQSQKLSKKVGLSEMAKKHLLYEHFDIHFKPILLVLETVASITNIPPETPHETWFHQRYSKTINEGIDKFKSLNSSSEPFNPHELWLSFKNMLQQLQHISYRRSVLKLDDVSPALKQLKGTRIPMPGVGGDKTTAPSLFIESVENHVLVLPTKTKPKKFLFVGTDGKRYAYLFKGMEDLHLDQRIMQILSLANVLLEDKGSSEGYRARHYGVIPLGPRSGLIQWVEGVTPLFALYKRWLQRQAANAVPTKGEKETPTAAVPRPSELFYNKLTPLLEAEGLSADPRQRAQWPIEILRRVLNELMEETPKDLVARELWLGSVNAEQWWNSTLRFGRSCAVMSVIGYIIGLGDRHLDNVLVDLRCGEVVHIDYNVCFEKGRQLRVPENVPFRLTANIRHALGAAGTGLEGTFRHSCIDVMKSLRENRDLFLILLEHFVYDPLVDWRSAQQHAGPGSHESTLVPLYVVDPTLAASCSRRKRRMETDATIQLFRLRSSELGPDWAQNRQELIGAVSSLAETASVWSELHAQEDRLREEVQDFHQDRLVLFDLRSDPNHVMRNAQQLQSIMLPLRTARESEKSVRSRMKEIVEEYSKWNQLYEMAFSSLTTVQLKQWTESVTQPGCKTGFPLVMEFLTNSGQGTLAQQGQALDDQVRSLEENQRSAASMVINLLGTYAALAAQYPSNKIENHRTYLMTLWVQEMDTQLSAETCQRLAGAFQQHFSLDSPAWALKQQGIVDFNLALRRLLNEATMGVHQTSLELAEVNLNSASSDLMDAKEAVNNYATLHGQKVIRYAVLNRLCRDDFSTSQSELDHQSLADMGAASCIAELLVSSDSIDQTLQDVVGALEMLGQLHQEMQEFVFNGTSILLPELIRLFECSSPDILHVHEELEALSIDINTSKMEMTRLGFQDLLSEGENGSLTQGQMLLLGLNGLFEKIESSLIKFVEFMKNCSALIPEDCIIAPLIEARQMMETELFDTKLEGIMLAQRLILMTTLFQHCSDWAIAFRNGQRVPNELQQHPLVDAFERTAGNWLNRFLVGATRFCPGALCYLLGEEKSSSAASLDELLTSIQKPERSDQACELICSVETSWRDCERIRRAHQRREMDGGLMQLFQQQLSAHAWLHDTQSGLNSSSGLFLLNLRQSLSLFLSQSTILTELQGQISALTTQVEQRLKWAAGANPNVRKIMQDFNEVQSECLRNLQIISGLAAGLSGVSSAILHYESFRTRTPEALAADSTFIQLLSQCQDVCLLKDGWTNGRLTESELRVAERIPIDGAATEEWINSTERALTDIINHSNENITSLHSKLNVCAEALRQLNAGMRATLTAHHQLVSDVRSILKAMAKCEVENGPVCRYLEEYRRFSELCSSVSRHLAAKEYDLNKISEIRAELQSLHDILDGIYSGLELLSEVFTEAPETKRLHEVNATAASVWHRVRMKLEGRDPEPSQQLSVEEQVDSLIVEATHLDNLALLYEGWTPWV